MLRLINVITLSICHHVLTFGYNLVPLKSTYPGKVHVVYPNYFIPFLYYLSRNVSFLLWCINPESCRSYNLLGHTFVAFVYRKCFTKKLRLAPMCRTFHVIIRIFLFWWHKSLRWWHRLVLQCAVCHYVFFCLFSFYFYLTQRYICTCHTV